MYKLTPQLQLAAWFKLTPADARMGFAHARFAADAAQPQKSVTHAVVT
jgi:hypothetical protein